MTKQNIDTNKEYKYGFTTDIESIKAPKGLTEDTIKFISKIKKEPKWMFEWRMKAFKRLQVSKEPNWQKPKFPKIDYQNLYYYSAPKSAASKPKSLDEVDPKLIETYNKLGIPLNEQKKLSGVAVDAVFDSVSVATTFKEELTKKGIIFCPISEAIQKHPELVKSSRGANGGYVLDKPASEIKLSNIIYAVDEEVKTLNCKKNSKRGCNNKSSKCITHNLWDQLDQHINGFFEKVKLQDLTKIN